MILLRPSRQVRRAEAKKGQPFRSQHACNVTQNSGVLFPRDVDDGVVGAYGVEGPISEWQRHQIGTRLLLVLAREAIAREARSLTLEVRLSNRPAQELYRRFGFAPVGVRKNYYAETNEDALVMWAHEAQRAEYSELLDGIERQIDGETVVEDPKRW